jgi:hypothetical protein
LNPASPQTGYYADLIEQAAALWESLAQNHPFIDGNKRTAFAATYTFLAINGGRITADAEGAYAFIMGLYDTQTFDFDHLTPWLRRHVMPHGVCLILRAAGRSDQGVHASDTGRPIQTVRVDPPPTTSV